MSPNTSSESDTAAIQIRTLWFWMELQRVAIMREITRVELQLASLTAALRSNKTS